MSEQACSVVWGKSASSEGTTEPLKQVDSLDALPSHHFRLNNYQIEFVLY